jgi:hypothetical protein
LSYFGVRSDTITLRPKLLAKDCKFLNPNFKVYLSVLGEKCLVQEKIPFQTTSWLSTNQPTGRLFITTRASRDTTTIENAPQWLIRLFQRLQKAEEDVRALAAAAASADAMDVDVSELRDDYKGSL